MRLRQGMNIECTLAVRNLASKRLGSSSPANAANDSASNHTELTTEIRRLG